MRKSARTVKHRICQCRIDLFKKACGMPVAIQAVTNNIYRCDFCLLFCEPTFSHNDVKLQPKFGDGF